MIDTTLAWLATYLIHSTVLILGVWGFTRWCAIDPLTRSVLWKIALVGGLFTATLQTGFGVRPALGQLEVTGPAPMMVPPRPPISIAEELAEPLELAEEVDDVVVLSIDDGDRSVTIVSLQTPTGPAWEPMPVLPPPATPPLAEPPPPAESGLSAALLGLFLGGAILGLGRLGFTARRLRRLLQGRVDLVRGSLAERLALLLARARLGRRAVRLTVSPALVSPIALASREIVVPEAAAELEARQQEAMLAHELAHVVRQDPAWLVMAAVIESVLFIQPLNRLARAGMQEAAEELADDWAVRHLGTGLHLARCLTEVASWQGRGGAPGPFVSSMASGGGSALVHRVQRLLDDGDRDRGRWSGVQRLLAGMLLLAGVAWGAPGIAVSVAQASPEAPAMPEPPEAPEAPEPPEPPDFEAAFEPFDADFEPALAMHTVAGDVAEARVIGAEPTRREKRMLRRAARHERKAGKLRAKGGLTQIVVDDGDVHLTSEDGHVIVIHEDDDDEDDDDDGHHRVIRVGRGGHGVDRAELERLREQARAARGIDRAELDRLREQAREAGRHAGRLSKAEIERIRREAAAMARNAPRFSKEEIERIQREAEAMARNAPRFSKEDIERIEREAEAMARNAHRLSAADIARIQAEAQRMAAQASRMSEEQRREMERAIEEAAEVDLEDLDEEIDRAVRRATEGIPDREALQRRVAEQVRRELEKAGKHREKAMKDTEKAMKDAEKAMKDAEKARERAERDREKAERDREKAQQKAEKDREKAREKAEEANRKSERKG